MAGLAHDLHDWRSLVSWLRCGVDDQRLGDPRRRREVLASASGAAIAILNLERAVSGNVEDDGVFAGIGVGGIDGCAQGACGQWIETGVGDRVDLSGSGQGDRRSGVPAAQHDQALTRARVEPHRQDGHRLIVRFMRNHVSGAGGEMKLTMSSIQYDQVLACGSGDLGGNQLRAGRRFRHPPRLGGGRKVVQGVERAIRRQQNQSFLRAAFEISCRQAGDLERHEERFMAAVPATHQDERRTKTRGQIDRGIAVDPAQRQFRRFRGQRQGSWFCSQRSLGSLKNQQSRATLGAYCDPHVGQPVGPVYLTAGYRRDRAWQ